MADSIKNKMEFIIEQMATFAIEIADLKQVQRQQTANIDKLTENINGTREMIHIAVGEMHQGFDNLISEMREGFDNLIIANEVTRKLAEDVGRLAVATNQRVSLLESKLPDKSNLD